jgi:hypothetical protein
VEAVCVGSKAQHRDAHAANDKQNHGPKDRGREHALQVANINKCEEEENQGRRKRDGHADEHHKTDEALATGI